MNAIPSPLRHEHDRRSLSLWRIGDTAAVQAGMEPGGVEGALGIVTPYIPATVTGSSQGSVDHAATVRHDFTVTWINNNGGDWATPSNWSGDELPGPTDDVGISTPTQEQITHLSGDDTVNSLTVGNDIFMIDDSSLTVSSGATFGFDLEVISSDLNLSTGNATVVNFALTADSEPLGITDGELDSSGTVTVSGNCLLGYYEGAVMSGAGTLLLNGDTTIDAANGSSLLGYFVGLDGGFVLANSGLATWTSGAIILGLGVGGGTIENLAGGTFDIDIDSPETISDGGGVTGFYNAGLLEMTQMTGQADIATYLTNTGNVSVQSGTLSLDAGGSSAANALYVAAGASIAFGTGTFTITPGGALTLAGTLIVDNQGTLELGAQNATVAGYSQASGVLDGTGTVTVTGQATLAGALGGGTLSGTGVFLLAGTTTVEGDVTLNAGRVVENAGTLDWQDGDWALGQTYGGATLNNLAGANFFIQSNLTIGTNGGPAAFNNAGLLEQEMTTGVTFIYVPFTNSGAGVVNIQSGVLSFDGGGSSNASAFIVASGAELAFIDNNGPSLFTLDGGTLNIAGSTYLGDGELDASAATIASFGATLTITEVGNNEGFSYPGDLELGAQSCSVANFVQSAGILDGSGTFVVTGSAILDNASGAFLESGSGSTLLRGATLLDGTMAMDGNRVLENIGTFTWTSGSIDLGANPFGTAVGGGTIDNAKGGVLNIENGLSIEVFGGSCNFNNAGLLEQTETTSTSDIYVALNDASSGTVSVVSGMLSLGVVRK